MAYSHLVSTSATFGAGNGSTTGINSSSADLLLALVSSYYGAPAPGLTDSKANSWSIAEDFIGSGAASCRLRLYYCFGGTVGTGHTVTCTASGAYGSVIFASYSGAVATPLDQHTSNGVAGVTSVQAGSRTPTEGNELVIACLGYQTAAAVASIDGGFTKRANENPQSGVSYGCALADLIQTSAAAANPSWSWTGAGDATALLVTFKAAAGGGGGGSAEVAAMCSRYGLNARNGYGLRR